VTTPTEAQNRAGGQGKERGGSSRHQKMAKTRLSAGYNPEAKGKSKRESF